MAQAPQGENQMKMFTIFDSKLGTYRYPTLSQNQATIVRELDNMLRRDDQKSNVLVTNPADFTLFEVGTWDEQTCTISMYEVKKSICTIIELIPPVQ